MSSKKSLVFLITLVLSFQLWADSLSDAVSIPYKKFVLDNGLTLLVHRDSKAPIVAVNIWYHVGSKDEKVGRTGFAHLFEHLMFNGSENHPGEWFDTMEKIGATDLNGTTWLDRTNYFQTVPKTALDTVLFMESDRMGHFLGAVTQEVLDEQRGVVQNEKRQGQNRPYGRSWEIMQAAVFPSGHPYSWTTIGNMEDLNASTLDDTYKWFKKYYGAANAVLVVAGDVDVAAVKTKVEKYFGSIAPGPALVKRKKHIAKRIKSSRDTMFDNVSHTRVTKVWNVAEFGTRDSAMLELAAQVLGGGKNSRLYKSLIYDTRLANSVSSSHNGFEIAGLFFVSVTVNAGQDSQQAEVVMHRELKRLIDKGPTKKELERIKNSMLVKLLKGLEKVGGFSGKAQLLARYQTYSGEADKYRLFLKWIESATPADVQDVAKRWLSSGDYTLVVEPQPKFTNTSADVDRNVLPMPVDFPQYSPPKVEKFELSNGVPVWFIPRQGLPVVDIQTLFKRGGFADDTDFNGLAKFTAATLMEGSKGYDALQMSAAIEQIGSSISVNASLDGVTASLSSLTNKLAKTLKLYRKVLREPAFDPDSIERVRANILAQIQKEYKQPFSQALRVLPELLFDNNHPYAKPLTGSGSEESVQAIQKQHINKFYRQFYLPSQAHFVVVGDIDKQLLHQALEAEFGDWQSDNKLPELDFHKAGDIADAEFYLLDKPDSPQALIIAGHLLPKEKKDGNQAFNMALRVLGGNFNSRINMNLREDKHWAYGARALKAATQQQQPLIYYASVQIDSTKDSIFEIVKEIENYVSTVPVTEEEILRGQVGLLASLPGRYETSSDLLSYLVGQVRYRRSDDYLNKYQADIRNLSVSKVFEQAKKHLNSRKMVWVIVGDERILREQLSKLPFDKTIKSL